MTDDSGVRTCSIARTLEVVGEKWTLLAVRELMLGNRRFEEIVRRTGAPRDILTNRLRKLEGAGLVKRAQYQARPDRFEYQLTDRGWSLHEIITMLREWGDEHLAGDDGPPALFGHDCGSIFHSRVSCEACGTVIEPDHLVLVEEPCRAILAHDLRGP